MPKFYALLLSIPLCSLPVFVLAGVYKQIDEQGNTIYTDVPTYKDQTPHNTGEVMTYDSKLAAPTVEPSSQPKTTSQSNSGTSYRVLEINNPKDDQTIRDNAGNVTVEFSAQPALDINAKHQFVLYLDGNKQQPVQNNSVNLQNIDRGTHTLAVEITDETDTTLIKSADTRFHLLRATAIHRKN